MFLNLNVGTPINITYVIQESLQSVYNERMVYGIKSNVLLAENTPMAFFFFFFFLVNKILPFRTPVC